MFMEQKIYYFDTCIWINLFKKEGDASKGVPYWKIAFDFIEYIEKTGGIIAISAIVFKELRFRLNEDFADAEKFLAEKECIEIIDVDAQDYNLARLFERKHLMLSFYDYLHTAISQRRGFLLITRDKALLEFASKHLTAFRPEDVPRWHNY